MWRPLDEHPTAQARELECALVLLILLDESGVFRYFSQLYNPYGVVYLDDENELMEFQRGKKSLYKLKEDRKQQQKKILDSKLSAFNRKVQKCKHSIPFFNYLENCTGNKMCDSFFSATFVQFFFLKHLAI